MGEHKRNPVASAVRLLDAGGNPMPTEEDKAMREAWTMNYSFIRFFEDRIQMQPPEREFIARQLVCDLLEFMPPQNMELFLVQFVRNLEVDIRNAITLRKQALAAQAVGAEAAKAAAEGKLQ